MEQRGAIFVLEDELLNIHWNARKAACLLQDLMDKFFIYGDEIQDERSIGRIRSEYIRATAKAEIARDLLAGVDGALKRLLEE